MADIPFSEGMAEQIISSDDSPSRFERFCIDLFRECDSHDYVNTSYSWDLGQDGRDVALAGPDETPIICCSLREDIPAKAEEDIRRLNENFKPKLLRYSSSRNLTEHAVHGIKETLRRLAPTLDSVAVVGANHIASLLVSDPTYAKVFERHYGGELQNWQTALNQTGETNTIKLDGMRLALTTQLTKTGDEMRTEVTRNMILTALADGKGKTKATIARLISEMLHLGKSVHESYISHSLDSLVNDGLVIHKNSGHLLSDTGRGAIASYTSQGSASLAEGRKLVKQAIVDLTGHKLSDTEYSRVWALIQDEISDMFYQHGMHVIEAIASISQGEGGLAEFEGLNDRIKGLGRKITSLLLGGSNAQEIGQAVSDMLFDKGSRVFDWFTDLCTCYIAVCSLGLEPAAQKSIAGRLRGIDLILDTDIILSYFCEGEPDHASIEELIRSWRSAGGSVLVSTSVLEEVAYHASIAKQDFNEVYHQMGKYEEDDARRLIMNAFVRGYWTTLRARKRNFSVSSWSEYIRNYTGRAAYDYSKIQLELTDNGFTVISDDPADDRLAIAVANEIIELQKPTVRNHLSAQAIDKARRDGRLVALLIRRRANRQGQGGSAAVVSSAALLRRACAARPELSGAPEPVMPMAAIAYLLSFIPGVNVSLFSLKKLLFNPGFKEGLSGLQRKALRIIFESNQYSLPYSRRAALQREMIDRMTKIAGERGQKPAELAEQIEKSREPEYADLLGEIVREAVDRVTESKSEKENAQLRMEIERLKKENDALRTGTAANKGSKGKR